MRYRLVDSLLGRVFKDVPMVKGKRLNDGKRAKPLFAYDAGLHY